MAQMQSALVQSQPEEAAEPASVTAEVFTVEQAAEGMRKQAMGNQVPGNNITQALPIRKSSAGAPILLLTSPVV